MSPFLCILNWITVENLSAATPFPKVIPVALAAACVRDMCRGTFGIGLKSSFS